VFAQQDHNDRLVILDELMPTDVTIEVFIEMIKKEINLEFPNAQCRYFGDPACVQVNDKSERTSWQIMRDRGIAVRYCQSDYRLRKELIEKKLGTLVLGKPMLLVVECCKILIEGFLGGYHYPIFEQGKQFNSSYEMPEKDGWYEHPMNALEYIIVNMYKALTPKAKPMIRRMQPEPANAGFGY
jgi:hypothetical protein